MSVRQDFINAYASVWGCSASYAEDLMGHLEAEHAHELAGQGRKAMGPRLINGEPEHIARYVSGWHDAMDHIDPEVEKRLSTTSL